MRTRLRVPAGLAVAVLLVVSVALPFRVLVGVGGGSVLVAVELIFVVVLVVDAVSVEGEQLAKFGDGEAEGLAQPGVCFAELVEFLTPPRHNFEVTETWRDRFDNESRREAGHHGDDSEYEVIEPEHAPA